MMMLQQWRKAKSFFQLANADYIGESVTQLQHALQCACAAKKNKHSEAVILASLFHDIGHFACATPQTSMKNLGVLYHEWIGAHLVLQLGLSTQVALLIGNHVNAKRYLAAKKPRYLEKLSEASQQTLLHQGGAMSANEIMQFEQHPLFKEILQVRVNDEKAKENIAVPELGEYEQLFCNLVTNKIAVTDVPAYVDKKWCERLEFTLMKGV